jgi:2'-5' RNA ligase
LEVPQIAYVTLRFDASTERAIVDLWLALTADGIELTGLSGHRPHITVAAYDTDDVPSYFSPLERFASGVRAIPLRFNAVGVFPRAGVVYLAPVVTGSLLRLHERLQLALSGEGRPAVHHAALLPESWMPHCTLVSGAAPGTIAQILSYFARTWEPIEGWIEGVGILTPPDIRDCFSVTFGGA